MRKNNKISDLPAGMLELDKLENLKLEGNTVAVMNTELSVVFGIIKVRQVLQSYFDKDKDSIGSSSKPGGRTITEHATERHTDYPIIPRGWSTALCRTESKDLEDFY